MNFNATTHKKQTLASKDNNGDRKNSERAKNMTHQRKKKMENVEKEEDNKGVIIVLLKTSREETPKQRY